MSNLSQPAKLYLIHSAALTLGLAISGVFYNLALVALGYDRQIIHLPLGTLSMLGVLNSLPALSAALGSLPLWWLARRAGLRAALLLATALTALSLLCVALWPGPLPLAAGATLDGLAAVLFQISAAPLMMRASDAKSRDALFSLSAGVGVGVAGLGSLVGGLVPGLAAQRLGLAPQGAEAYRATFAVAAVVVLASAAPLLLLRLPPARGHEAGVPERSRDLLRSIAATPWGTLRFLVSPVLISCGAALLIPYLGLYFRTRYGAPDALLGLILALIGVATGLATLIAPRLSARLGRPGSVVLTQALAIPCLLLLGVAPTLGAAAIVAVVRGALMNMASPLYQAHAMEQTPEAARPVVIGLIGGAYSVGYILGPAISAEIQRFYGFPPIFAATAACYCLAAIANYLIFMSREA